MSDMWLPAGLAFIMLALGLGLTPADFSRVLARPKAVGVGVLAQVLGLPLVAWGVVSALGLTGTLAVGVFLLAACPGGASAGLLTRLAGGETALSIALTALTSVGVLFSLPLVMGVVMPHYLGSEASITLPLGRTLGGLLLTTVLPVLLGVALRLRWPATICRLEPACTRLATTAFLGIVLATFVQHQATILAHLTLLGPALGALNLGVMALGLACARAVGLPHAGGIALAMECGLQNAALGIFVAHSLLASPTLAIPAVVYAFLMNVTALAWVSVRRWRRHP